MGRIGAYNFYYEEWIVGSAHPAKEEAVKETTPIDDSR